MKNVIYVEPFSTHMLENEVSRTDPTGTSVTLSRYCLELLTFTIVAT